MVVPTLNLLCLPDSTLKRLLPNRHTPIISSAGVIPNRQLPEIVHLAAIHLPINRKHINTLKLKPVITARVKTPLDQWFDTTLRTKVVMDLAFLEMML
jgi:hypothetical protein